MPASHISTLIHFPRAFFPAETKDEIKGTELTRGLVTQPLVNSKERDQDHKLISRKQLNSSRIIMVFTAAKSPGIRMVYWI